MRSTSWPGLYRPSTSWSPTTNLKFTVCGRAPRLRRRLLARLIDRDVLAMCHRGAAVGDDQRVQLDEAVALLFIIAGDFCARRQFVTAASGVEQLHPAADVNPGPEDGVVDQHLVHDPLQQAGMAETFACVDRIALADVIE